MLKKLTLLAMAVGAVAVLAVPAAASASGQLSVGKIPLIKGAKITAVSSNIHFTTGFYKIACTKILVHNTVNTNTASGSTQSGVGSGPGTCSVEENGAPVGTPTLRFNNFILGPNSLNSRNTNFTLVFSNFPNCTYTSDVPAYQVAWEGGSSNVVIAAHMTDSGSECLGEAQIAGEFHLATEAGAAVLIS
jgi:hypothetical protein